METADVVIAGAGIIGLSLALDLAQHNLSVIVLERSTAMTEASWAAGGMLAANDPENPPEIHELAQLSLRLYPAYLATIERLSNKKVPIRTHETFQAIIHPANGFQTLTANELRQRIPQLNSKYQFVHLDEQSLDPRDLCIALPLAAKAAGVHLRENSPAISVDTSGHKVIIQTPAEPIAATHFVNAAGAWADFPALTIPPAPSIGVRPCKGQMTTVRLRTHHRLAQVLRTPEIYLIPRDDRRITLGATAEYSGFDKSVEPAAIGRLFAAAADLWPPIAEAEILESWTGLRPATPNQLPLIGQLAPNRWLATGHFRNGILLAPATAHVLSQAIRGDSTEIDLSPFHPAQQQAEPLTA